jgi:murein DD-endopeptidase MepM/ murein hydrolase activator NlpD
MRIKFNNIFKKKQGNLNIQKRRKVKNENVENNDASVQQEVKTEYRRRGAIRNKKEFNLLNILKERFVIKRSYYALLLSMTILAIISVYTNIVTYKRLNDENFEVFGSNDNMEDTEEVVSSISEELQDSNSNNIDTRKTSETQVSVSKSNVNQEDTKVDSEGEFDIVSKSNVNQEDTKPKVVPLVFSKPLNGEILKTYSMDKLLYSNTLESWKTHDGVDIKADIGTNVKSIEKGIVEKIYDDSFLGTTVIIDHGQGYKSIYSNLDKNVLVKEKETIIKSKVIGKVGQTAIGEIKDEPHIHFMIMFNNKVIDPTSKIKF